MDGGPGPRLGEPDGLRRSLLQSGTLSRRGPLVRSGVDRAGEGRVGRGPTADRGPEPPRAGVALDGAGPRCRAPFSPRHGHSREVLGPRGARPGDLDDLSRHDIPGARPLCRGGAAVSRGDADLRESPGPSRPRGGKVVVEPRLALQGSGALSGSRAALSPGYRHTRECSRAGPHAGRDPLVGLAVLYEAQARYGEAESLYRRALAFRRRPVGRLIRSWPRRSTVSPRCIAPRAAGPTPSLSITAHCRSAN